MKKLWLGLAMSSTLLLTACGNENKTASEMTEATEMKNEYAEIDERMHEYAITQLVGADNYLEGLFYEGDMDNYEKRTTSYTLPSNFEDFKSYFQLRNIDNSYDIWRNNLYEVDGYLLYVVRYQKKSDDTHYASPFLVEKIEGKWEIRHDPIRDFRLPLFEGYFKKGKLTGSGIAKLNELYPEYATEIVSKEQTNAYFSTLTEAKKLELQQLIDEREAYYD